MDEIRLSEKVNKCFLQSWNAMRDEHILKIVEKGGRGSGKSYDIALRIVVEMMRDPVSALVVRKVGNTLSTSVFEQIKDAISILGVEKYWKINSGTLRMTYLPFGNQIVFKGADDPMKIKSLKIAKCPVTILWIEELAEFKTEDEVTTIENSVLRDERRYLFFYSYNPPKRKQSWVNKKYNSCNIARNTFVNHSTYLDNPHTAKATIEEAEELKRVNKEKYEWIYLGKPIGSGVVPFSNLEFREITDEEISQFDNIRQGLDFGYATDPLAFIRLHYDKKKRTIYIFDELFGVKMFNRELAELLKKKRYDRQCTIADSVEPKSIAELRTLGINIRGAKKGKDSVSYGESWLDDLEAIVIDPKRSPNTAREFENIDYATDRYGEILNRLEDKDNHSIDATRYALNDDMKNTVWFA